MYEEYNASCKNKVQQLPVNNSMLVKLPLKNRTIRCYPIYCFSIKCYQQIVCPFSLVTKRVFLYIFIWQLYCLSFVELRILITPFDNYKLQTLYFKLI